MRDAQLDQIPQALARRGIRLAPTGALGRDPA